MNRFFVALIVAALSIPQMASARTGIAHVVCGLDPNGDNFLALRAGPSARTPTIMRLGPGTRVLTWGRQGNWMNVTVGTGEGPAGWVFGAYICQTEY